jgi:hypothetical protein
MIFVYVPANVSLVGQQLAEKVLAARAADTRLLVSARTTKEMLGIQGTKYADLVKSGGLATVVDGRERKTVVASIYDRLLELICASHPADAPPTKVREVKTVFRRKPRPRTEAELRGLAKGNQRRHEEKLEKLAREAAGTASS